MELNGTGRQILEIRFMAEMHAKMNTTCGEELGDEETARKEMVWSVYVFCPIFWSWRRG